MGEYYATVRLSNNNAIVSIGREKFTTVSPNQGLGLGANGGCPIAYLVTALGS